MKKFIPFIFLFIYNNSQGQYNNSQGQVRFSFAPDIMVVGNFSPKQKFWAIGQTIRGQFHFTQKETIYAFIGYHSKGSFENKFTATAKSTSTVPASILYNVKGTMRSNQISIGWQHFWWGGFNSENTINIYTFAGFGIMFGHSENVYSTAIDTSLYDNSAAPLAGKGKFKRLTFDIGLGAEYPLGGTLYAYGDIRTWLPTTDYPSPYLHNNEKVPLPVIFSVGLRILFGNDY